MGRSHLLPGQLPGEHTGPQASYSTDPLYNHLLCYHSHTHLHMVTVDKSIVVGQVLIVHICSFMCTWSYRYDNTHPCLLMSWEALWDPLVCSCDISHNGTWQVTITSSASQTVTHPSINQAHGCPTSVIGLQMVVPCQRGSSTELVQMYWRV